MNKWEVWLAKVKFEDDPTEAKLRPVLVIDLQRVYFISLKVTTHEPRPCYYGEYPLQKWQAAGLDKPSTVRVSKRLQLIERDFVKKIGRLHPNDILAIQKMLLQ